MDFTGYSYRKLLDLRANNFSFQKLSINEPGYSHRIIFSGEGKTFGFVFSGHKIFDNSSEYFWSFNSGESLDFEVRFKDSVYSYYVNSGLLADGYRDNFKLEKLVIDTSGAGMSFTPSFSSDTIDLNINISSPSFSSGENVNFELTNLSPANVKVYSTAFKNSNDGSPDLSFENNQTGLISGFQTLKFTSKDTTENDLAYRDFEFTTLLSTNAGDFLKSNFANRTSTDPGSSLNYTHSSIGVIDHFFIGETGLNSFEFLESVVSKNMLISMRRIGRADQFLPTTGFLQFDLTGVTGLHTGGFITGVSILHGGVYSEAPSVVFSNFSGVRSISVNEKNLISYSAGDSFPLVFSGNGSGVSATAFTKKFNIQLFTGENPSFKFRTITGVVVDSYGYGFNQDKYSVSIPDVVIDYPKSYGDPIASSLGYAPVKFSSDFFISAGLASGVVVLSETYPPEISGVIILGPGSGYDQYQQPSLSFSRSDSDLYLNTGANVASGVCSINTSGEQIGFDNWEVLASRTFSNDDLDYTIEKKTVSGAFYFGPIIFHTGEMELNVKVTSTNSKIYEQNGLKFHLYETGSLGPVFSVYSNNNYFISQDLFGVNGVEFLDLYNSE